ncbi:cell wall hydrolase, partial [bacterium]|nr:cell wall hydrolase [bacterium]
MEVWKLEKVVDLRFTKRVCIVIFTLVLLFMAMPSAAKIQLTAAEREFLFCEPPAPYVPQPTVVSVDIVTKVTVQRGNHKRTVTVEDQWSFTEADVDILALIIYNEAGSDACTDEHRRMVGDVFLNRVDSDRFPNTFREVALQKGQYFPLWKTGLVWPAKAESCALERRAAARARQVARELLAGKHSRLYGRGYVWQAAFR